MSDAGKGIGNYRRELRKEEGKEKEGGGGGGEEEEEEEEEQEQEEQKEKEERNRAVGVKGTLGEREGKKKNERKSASYAIIVGRVPPRAPLVM